MWCILLERICYYSVDATYETCIGRFSNDAPTSKANAQMKRMQFGCKAHIVLFASKTIRMGDEITYDYGVKNLKWRKKVFY